MFERTHERILLTEGLERASSGNGGMILIRGAAGSGKSAVLEAACTTAEDEGIRVVRGFGDPFERSFAFGTMRQLLGAALSASSSDELSQVFTGAAAGAQTLFAASTVGAVTEERQVSEFLDGLTWLIRNLAKQGPLVIAVDDADLCDRASLRALVRIARQLRSQPVLALLSLSAGEPRAEADLLSWLEAAQDSVTIELAPLSRTAVESLAESLTGATASEAFITECMALTGGNPFLARHLLHDFGASRAVPDDAAGARLGQMMPDGVLRSVRARLSTLDRSARLMADALAVIGTHAPSSLVADLAGLNAEEARASSIVLTQAELFKPCQPLTFAHPLIGTAVYRLMPATAVERAHAQAAELLLHASAPLEDVAAHLLRTPALHEAWVVDVLLRAAELARKMGFVDRVVPLLRRALDEQLASDLRETVLRELAFAEAAVGHPAGIDLLVDVMRTTVDPGERIRTRRELARLQFLDARPGDAAVTIREAMAEVNDRQSASDLLAEFLTYATFGASGLDRALRTGASHEIVELLGRIEAGSFPENPGLLVQAASILSACRGPRELVVQLIDRMESTTSVVPVPLDGMAKMTAIVALISVDEIDLADRIAERCWEETSKAQSAHDRALVAFARALVTLHRGPFDRAIHLVRSAVDLGGSAAPWTLVWSRALLSETKRLLGDLAGAERALADIPRADGDDPTVAIGLHARARLNLTMRRPTRAWQDAHLAADALQKSSLRDHPLLPWRLTAARAGQQIGYRRQGRDYAEEELDLAHRSGAPNPIGQALLVLAEVADPGEQLALLAEAVEILSASQSRVSYAQALYQFAVASRREGDAQRALELLGNALDLAVECAHAPLVRNARRELRQLGVRTPAPFAVGAEFLTGAERRVATLAAAGHTNRQIAEILHVTVSTVEFQLTRTFRRLGVHSRSELTSEMASIKRKNPSSLGRCGGESAG